MLSSGTENSWIRQIPGSRRQGNAGSPVGPALGQYGINIGQFTKDFNERTKGDMGMMIPVVITVYADRSFSFITKTPRQPCLSRGLRHRACFRCAPER